MLAEAEAAVEAVAMTASEAVKTVVTAEAAQGKK
jgi:hypothetical protein